MVKLEEIKAALDDINFPIDSLLKLVNSASSPYETDSKGLDILHYAIIANSPEAVRLLFLRGLFKTNNIVCNYYLHLACSLGHASLVSIILQERPSDYTAKGTVCYPEDCIHNNGEACTECNDLEKEDKAKERNIIDNVADLSCNQPKLALDFAGEAGHLRCVQNILNCHSCKHTCFLECACDIDSPAAVDLLLEKGNLPKKDLNSALIIAVRLKRANCLDLLLTHGASVENAFQGLNLYHVMYMYSSGFGGRTNRLVGLAGTTKTLIKHSVDVNTSKPIGSFPLYSLLVTIPGELDTFSSNAMVESDLLTCLRLLFVAGANANFNEHENADGDTLQHAYGRQLFSSAISCLFNSFGNWKLDNPAFSNMLEECTKLLLQYHANPNIVDFTRGFTGFHDACYLLGVSGYRRALPIIRMFMKLGADPDKQTIQKHFPACIYTAALFSDVETSAGTLAKYNAYTKDALCYLHDFMEVENMVKTFRCAQKALKEGLALDYLILNQQLEIKPLFRMCRICIWKYVDRNAANVSKLNLPSYEIHQICTGLFQ